MPRSRCTLDRVRWKIKIHSTYTGNKFPEILGLPRPSGKHAPRKLNLETQKREEMIKLVVECIRSKRVLHSYEKMNTMRHALAIISLFVGAMRKRWKANGCAVARDEDQSGE